ncbi:hypothetical protein L3Y34_001110 [Caenorhabditis briggsae]|uniref:Domain of unknown function WSN domain-containing protein n=1 Tax=Caenorhabditis briggsae TaxID=6238 RepID=A0AAE9IP44_CAEBR|nr:hypothetical protein L3Y34_001110 [Caenorhabditis briggsae]
MHLANSLFFLICTLFVIGESGQTHYADSLYQFVNKMTTLARLTNGVVLEKGLLEGSIPSDDVISKFLHMGTLTIDELLNLNTVQLNKSFTELHHLSENLVSSNDVEAVESRFEILNEVRKLALQLWNITSLPGLEDYKKSMNQLVAIPLDGKELDKLFTKFDDFEKRIENITEMEVPANSTEKNKAMAEIRKIIGMYIAFEKEVNTFNAFYEKIDSLKLLAKLNMSFLDPLDEEMELRQKYITESTSGVRIKLDLIRNNVEQFLNSSIIFQNSQGLVSPVQRLISARQNAQNWKNIYSIGLPNGLTDFQNISSDTNDMKSLISKTDSDWVSKHLSRSLNPIVDFGKNISLIHDSWAYLSSVDDLDSVVQASEELAKYANEKDTILQLMEAFEECDKFSENETSKAQSIEKINDWRSAASELYKVLSEFKSFDYLKKMPSSSKYFNNYETWNVLTNKSLLKLQSKPAWERAKVALENLKKDFPEFKKSVSIVQTALEKLNPILIEEYLKSLEDSGFLNFYSSLRDKIGGKEEDGKIILDLLKELSELRRNRTNYKIQEVIDVVGILSNSLEDLKSLKGWEAIGFCSYIVEQVKCALDLFFSSFRSKIPPAPTTTITPQITTIQTTTLSVFPSTVMALGLNQTANTMPEWQIGLIVAIGLITTAFIFTILSYCRKWFCFKNKKSKSSKSENDISFILWKSLRMR